MHMNIDGACLCGFIRYEARIDSSMVRVCHCTHCQIQSASAFRYGVLVDREHFRMLGGEPKVYVKTAESGKLRALAFCPECGTSIYGTSVEEPRIFSLRLGTATQRALLAPTMQIWARSAVPWLSELHSVPGFATVPSAHPATDPTPSASVLSA